MGDSGAVQELFRALNAHVDADELDEAIKVAKQSQP